jgi:hypothetical protein
MQIGIRICDGADIGIVADGKRVDVEPQFVIGISGERIAYRVDLDPSDVPQAIVAPDSFETVVIRAGEPTHRRDGNGRNRFMEGVVDSQKVYQRLQQGSPGKAASVGGLSHFSLFSSAARRSTSGLALPKIFNRFFRRLTSSSSASGIAS